MDPSTTKNLLAIPRFGNDEYQPDGTLINTKLEISLPGFLSLEYQVHFEILEPLTSESTPKIFKGKLIDPNLQMKYGLPDVVVKKLLNITGLTEEQNRLKFEQEVAILWSLNQTNIIQLLGYCENPRYIITKLYSTDLFQFIHTPSVEIPPEILLNLGLEIATGLNAIHANKIAHRDIKSPNVLLEMAQTTKGVFL